MARIFIFALFWGWSFFGDRDGIKSHIWCTYINIKTIILSLLDEASLQFNADPDWGLALLQKNEILNIDDPTEIAQFIHGTNKLHWKEVRDFVSRRYDVLDALASNLDFKVRKMTFHSAI